MEEISTTFLVLLHFSITFHQKMALMYDYPVRSSLTLNVFKLKHQCKLCNRQVSSNIIKHPTLYEWHQKFILKNSSLKHNFDYTFDNAFKGTIDRNFYVYRTLLRFYLLLMIYSNLRCTSSFPLSIHIKFATS